MYMHMIIFMVVHVLWFEFVTGINCWGWPWCQGRAHDVLWMIVLRVVTNMVC